MHVVNPHWTQEPEILEIYFLSCWFYKTINRHQVKPCQSPCWTMMVLFTWKRKLAWAAAFINFPFLFFAHYLFVVAWRRPILGPAGCPVRMASPKISSSQRWPFCSFATADVCRSKKTALSHSLFTFVTSLVFSGLFFFSLWVEKTLIETSANSKINTAFITLIQLFQS